jgi:vancomycin resistance protein YoaR
MKTWQIITLWLMVALFGLVCGYALFSLSSSERDWQINHVPSAGAEAAVPIAPQKAETPLEKVCVSLCLEGQKYCENACIPAHIALIAARHGGWHTFFARLLAEGADVRRILNYAAYPLGDGLGRTLASIETPPLSAEVVLGEDKPTVSPHRDGYTFDRAALLAAVADCLCGVTPEPLYLRHTPAAVTTAQLQAQTALIATFSTPYAEVADRVHNLRLACHSLNATTVAAGAVFSFNQTVGARTLERGYRKAKIIADGAYTEGVGGGVCQVSTTLYNAAMAAGMTQTEVHRHSIAVHYVAPSRDAMVSSWSDMRFANTGHTPLYIYAAATHGAVTVRLYGTPPTQTIRLSATAETVEPHRNVDCEGNLLADTQGYRLISAGQDAVNGTLIRWVGKERQVLRRNAYPRRDAVWQKCEQTDA